MSVPARLRTPNPHLGAFYGIITSAFVSLAIMLALFEQLGWREVLIAYGMIVLPLVMYLGIAGAARTRDVDDYFVSGRRVPPVFNGFVLAAIAVGGTFYFAYTGAAFLIGFDAFGIGLGLACGMLAASVLFMPYLRKAGAYTLPSFLGHRFRSRRVRIFASALLMVPTVLLLAAEMKIAGFVAALFIPFSSQFAVVVIAALIATVTLLGGMRALTWTGSAQFLVGAIGFSVPLIIVSVLLTHLPAPPFTYGETLSSLQIEETNLGQSAAEPGPFASALPGTAPQASPKPLVQPFGAIDRFDFVVLFLCLALGTASLPSLLTRSGVTSSVADQRRSGAWAVLFVSLFVISAPSLAAFAKQLLFQDIGAAPGSAAPTWLTQLGAIGLAYGRDANGDGLIGASELLIARDAVVLALPMAAKLPFICTVLMAAGGLAVALAASASHLFTIGGSVAEDIVRLIDRSGALPRLVSAWVAIAAVALGAAVFLAIAEIDLLRTAIAAMAFAASTFFPVLVLSIWWERCSRLGAMLAMGVGFAVMALAMVFSSSLGLTAPLAALLGVVAGFGAGVAASLLGPQPSSAEQTYFEELRDSRGEAIYDRAQRRPATPAIPTPADAAQAATES